MPLVTTVSLVMERQVLEPTGASSRGWRESDYDEGQEPDFKSFSAAEAERWREENPPLPLWRVFAVQFGVALALVLAVALLTGGDRRLTLSLAWGAVAALLPAGLFTRVAVRRMQMQTHAGAALMALLGWEGVKIGLTIALLLAAPRLVEPLSWLALLAGFVVTIKASWVALWLLAVRREKLAPRV